MIKIAILITSHNRKEFTVLCLQHIFNSEKLNEFYIGDIYLVDDGSSDGTYEVIQNEYPSVHLIKGTGKLYWNRGMHLAWKTAAKRFDYDYYLWVNDDTFLFPESIFSLLSLATQNTILCGPTKSPIDNLLTYGGYKNTQLLAPNGYLQVCDHINGNCVLVSRKIFKTIGNLDFCFRHNLGDFDYGKRAIKAGFTLVLQKDYVGFCERNDYQKDNFSTKNTFIDRLIKFYSVKFGGTPIERFIYNNRHEGFILALKCFISSHLHHLGINMIRKKIKFLKLRFNNISQKKVL